jgi:tripartite-type tricarboxylate transporter receptor subunit TctC
MLAVAMQERHYLYPSVPTMKELGVNLDTGNWVGFIAPKGVPEEIIAKLDRAIEKALKSPEVVSSWTEMGNVTTYLNHKDFAKWLVPHVAETRALVESLGLLVVPKK